MQHETNLLDALNKDARLPTLLEKYTFKPNYAQLPNYNAPDMGWYDNFSARDIFN